MDSCSSVTHDIVKNGSQPAAVKAAGERKLLLSNYKGVVPQPNGRWGAQIYIKHQRIWLGTFADEKFAAKNYDIAAQRFRGWDTFTNFKPLSSADPDDGDEMEFLKSHSETEIVDMVRKQTYHVELLERRKNSSSTSSHSSNLLDDNLHGCHLEAARTLLFEKMVTQSDVGKLNRLVIPKQQAERHLPPIEGPTRCMLLNFLDVNDKVWRFRYSYWNSSRCYVLSRGWTWFVKDKNLKAGDVVCFEQSIGADKKMYINFRSAEESVQSNVGDDGRDRPPRLPLARLFGVEIGRIPVTGDGA